MKTRNHLHLEPVPPLHDGGVDEVTTPRAIKGPYGARKQQERGPEEPPIDELDDLLYRDNFGVHLQPDVVALFKAERREVPVHSAVRYGDALLAVLAAIPRLPALALARPATWDWLLALLDNLGPALADALEDPKRPRWVWILAGFSAIELDRTFATVPVPAKALDAQPELGMAWEEAYQEFRGLIELIDGDGANVAERVCKEAETLLQGDAQQSTIATIGLYVALRTLEKRWGGLLGAQPALAYYRKAMRYPDQIPDAAARDDLPLRHLVALRRGELPRFEPLPPDLIRRQDDGVMGRITGFWKGRPATEVVKVVRIGAVGPPSAGKSWFYNRVVIDSRRVEIGAPLVWKPNAIDTLKQVGAATMEPVVRIDASTNLGVHGLIRVDLVDTAGRETLTDARDPSWIRETSRIDLMALVVSPDYAHGLRSREAMAFLGEIAANVLKTRPIASTPIIYSKADELGLRPSSMGRLVGPAQVPSLTALAAELRAGKCADFAGRLVRALHLDQRFPCTHERHTVEDLIRATADLWLGLLIIPNIKPMYQINAYLCSVSALPESESGLDRGVGVDQVLSDFFGARVKQPSWPFWVRTLDGAGKGAA